MSVFQQMLKYRFKIEEFNATLNQNKQEFTARWFYYKPLFTDE